jgi:hypothetical protein
MKKWVGMTICLAAAAFAPVSGVAAPYTGPPTPCDRGITVKDAAPILKGNATVNHYSMAASMPGEGCELGVVDGTTIAMVDFAVTKGSLDILLLGRKHTPIPGFGDEAYFVATTASNIPHANETDVYVKKGPMICSAQLHRTIGGGDKMVIPTSDHDIAMKLGTLCMKAMSIAK